VTKRAGVPLLINDRVDVAASIKCEGVHVGQDDTGINSCSHSRYNLYGSSQMQIWLRQGRF
jgi:thiamine monophosphate synthase